MSIEQGSPTVETKKPSKKNIFKRIAGAFAARQTVESPSSRERKLRIGEINHARTEFDDPSAPFVALDEYTFGEGTYVPRESLTPTMPGESIVVKYSDPDAKAITGYLNDTYTVVNPRDAHLDPSNPHDLGADYWRVKFNANGSVNGVEQQGALYAFPSEDQMDEMATMGARRTVYRAFRGHLPEDAGTPDMIKNPKDAKSTIETLELVLDLVSQAKAESLQ